jgi:uncharacterized membrane protein
MDQIQVRRVKGLRIAVAAFALSVFLFVAMAGGTVYLLTSKSDDNADFSTELRNGLVESCEVNGNPLREAVRHQINEQIQQREQLDYARFFPNIPTAELKLLLDQQTEADRERLKEIAPVNCASLYPKP